jgi:hypothetical protein
VKLCKLIDPNEVHVDYKLMTNIGKEGTTKMSSGVLTITI